MSPKQRPNVIVFFTDQQRADSTGVHGNPMGLTPNFDRMAREGTHMAHGFTCQPVCLPARASFQTGKYAAAVNCHSNGQALPTDAKTMAHYFNAAGYCTGYIGKWHVCTEEPVPVQHRGGYQNWLGANVLEFVSDAYDCVMFDDNNEKVKMPGYRVDAQTDAAIRFIDQHQQDPFFLFCSYIEPHFQNHRDDYPAPTGYEEKYLDAWMPPDLRTLGGTAARHLPGYYGMIKRLDEALGRIQDALKSMQLDENTIILFTSDHGCHFKTRNSEYKRSCHDSSIRIPMAATGGPFTSGGCLKEMISLVDMAPTLLDACGIEVPADMHGRSLLPLTQGRREGWPEEVFVQISEASVSRAIRTHRWKYSVTAMDYSKIIPGGASSSHYEETELFDLMADPYELNNLVELDSHTRVREVMRARLLKRMAEADEDIPTIAQPKVKPGWQKRVSEKEALD